MSQELFYLILNDEEAGPYTLGQLQAMWRSGQVTAKTHVWSEGRLGWERLLTMAAVLDPASDSPPKAPITTTQTAKKNKYVCPHCQSENIQSARNLYEGGTATSVSATRGIGLGIDASGSELIGGSAVTMKKQQTLLASRYAPPTLPKLSQTGPTLLAIGGFLFAGFALIVAKLMDEGELEESGPYLHQICAVVGVIVGVVMVAAAIRLDFANRERHKRMGSIYEKQQAQWLRSYLCNKCGYFGELADP